jgi:hypothetical protein
MQQRPLSVTIVSWIYLVTGIGGIAAHAREFNPHHFFQLDPILPLTVRLLAIVAGIFMLRGHNWARWLAIMWIGYHVVCGSMQSLRAGVFHAVLFAMFAYLLFRPAANRYFQSSALKPMA